MKNKTNLRAELKPCPFCGKNDKLNYSQPCADAAWGVSCNRCHVTLDSRKETHSDARDVWNCRPTEVLHENG